MGNRAVVVFTDGGKYSPSVYLHWGGSSIPALLAAVRERMGGREGDLDYTAARFIGLAHETTPGNLSLGVSNLDATDIDALRAAKPGYGSGLPMCCGDAGVFVVNVKTWTVQRLSGRLGDCDAPRVFQAGRVEFSAEELATMGEQ